MRLSLHFWVFCSYQLSCGDKALRVINWIYCSLKCPGSLSLHTLPSAKWRYIMFATDIYSPRKSLTVMYSKFIAFFSMCFIISFLPQQDFLSQSINFVSGSERHEDRKSRQKTELNQQTKKQRKQNNANRTKRKFYIGCLQLSPVGRTHRLYIH